MKASEIKLHGFYVNHAEYTVREIIEPNPNGGWTWRAYDLKTGEPFGLPGSCLTKRMAEWAGREATPEEVSRLHREKTSEAMRQLTEEMKRLSEELTQAVLVSVSDEQLSDELRRRGIQTVTESEKREHQEHPKG